MQVNNNSNLSFGAIKVPTPKNSKAEVLCNEIYGMFKPGGVTGGDAVTWFFDKPEQEDIAKRMLIDNMIPHIYIPDKFLKSNEDRLLFSNINFFC